MWSPNWELATTCIGETVGADDLVKFSYRLEFIGEKIFVSDFIEFQYGELSEKCKPHQKVIATLKKYGLIDRVSKGYVYPLQRVQEEDKEKEEEKETDKEKDLGKSENPLPEVTMPARQPITQEMVGEWMKLHPDYPYSQEQDFHAVLQIGKFIADQVKSKWLPETDVGYELIIHAWIRLIGWQKQDDFYKGFSLSYLAKTATLQTIWQKSKEQKNGTAHKQTLGVPQFNPALATQGGFGEL